MVVTCKGENCGLKRDFILKHFAQSPNCKRFYTKDELLAFEIESKNRAAKKRKERRKIFYDSNKRALKYQKEKRQISERYDSAKRAEKYQLDKECNKIVKGKKKYDSQKRAERYRMQKAELKKLYDPQKRRKKYKLSKSRKAKAFSGVVCVAYKIAWGKIFDIHFKRFRRQVKKEISSSGFVGSKRILREKVEKMIDTKMELFSQKLPDYDEGLKQVFNKAFKFYYKERFQRVYYKAFNAAMDSVFKSSSVCELMWEKKSSSNNPQAKVDEKFQSFLDVAVQKSSQKLINGKLFNLSFQHLTKSLIKMNN